MKSRTFSTGTEGYEDILFEWESQYTEQDPSVALVHTRECHMGTPCPDAGCYMTEIITPASVIDKDFPIAAQPKNIRKFWHKRHSLPVVELKIHERKVLETIREPHPLMLSLLRTNR